MLDELLTKWLGTGWKAYALSFVEFCIQAGCLLGFYDQVTAAKWMALVGTLFPAAFRHAMAVNSAKQSAEAKKQTDAVKEQTEIVKDQSVILEDQTAAVEKQTEVIRAS